jgi:hypothetical protein
VAHFRDDILASIKAEDVLAAPGTAPASALAVDHEPTASLQ